MAGRVINGIVRIEKARHEDQRSADERNDGQPRHVNSPKIDGRRTVAQIAEAVKAGTDPKSEKIRQLVHEGYPQDQAIAIAYAEERAGKL